MEFSTAGTMLVGRQRQTRGDQLCALLPAPRANLVPAVLHGMPLTIGRTAVYAPTLACLQAPTYTVARMKICSPLYSAWLLLCIALLPAAAAPLHAAAAAQEILAPAWFKPTFLDFRDDAREAGAAKKHLMIYVGQHACSWCKRLIEVNFRDPTIVDKMQKNFDAVEMNIVGSSETVWTDGTRASEKTLAARLKVRYTPTLLFLDERGAVVLRLNGYYEPDRFLMALDYVGNRDYRNQPDFQAYLKARGVSAEERSSRVTP